MKRVYEISLNSLSINGRFCKDLEVEWEKPDCLNIKCEYNGDTLTVTIPEECEGECVYGIVKCNDNDCSDCPSSERIKICPCTESAECEDCEKCVNNICVSTCPDDKFCDNDRCVDCSNDVPCPKNQVCVAGECKCPPSKPFLNDKGECVSCLTDGDCPPCTICTPNGCVPIECPEGACDPETGDCVDCVNTGDCTKDNECCVDKGCECCPGFVRNVVTGECEPAPECQLDSDCEECEICVDGLCVPVECPDGFICVGGDCKPECDCADATCSKNQACVNLDPNNCYCNECEGDCIDGGDCGEGCYCLNGKCTPKPCKGSCVDGSDCGDGCGCLDGECVPCNAYNCTTGDCQDILGCNCTGQGCRDIGGCDGPCDSSNDCGDGCTCYKGECTPCGDFPCDGTDCSDKPGCECVNGNCEGDGGGSCNDVFEITKVDDSCDIEAELNAEESCSCSKLTANSVLRSVNIQNNQFLLNLDVELRKGAAVSLAQARTLPKLGDTGNPNIADNEAPSAGTIKVLIQPFYDEFDVDGRRVAVNVPGTISQRSVSFANASVVDTASFNNLAIPSIGSQVGDFLVVSKVEVTVQQSTDLKFPNNCSYDSVVIIDSFTIRNSNVDTLEGIANGSISLRSDFEGYAVLESDDIRYPLFTWYRSTDGVYSDNEVFRNLYVPEDNAGNFTDVLYGPKDAPIGKFPLVPEEGGIRSGKYFAVKNDCSCETDADLGKVVFCNPDELVYEAKECNTKVKLLRPFEPCSVNQDLTKFGINDPSSQVKYDLLLNGTKVATFVDSQFGMVIDGTNNSMFTEFNLGGEVITEIRLSINHDDTAQCDLVYNLEDFSQRTVDYTAECQVSGSQYIVNIPKVNNGNGISDVKIVTGGGSVDRSDLTDFIVSVNKGVETQLLITYDDGCSKSIFLYEDCCEEFASDGFDFWRKSSSRDSELDLGLDINGGVSPYYIEFTGPFQGAYIYETGTGARGTGDPIGNNVPNTGQGGTGGTGSTGGGTGTPSTNDPSTGGGLPDNDPTGPIPATVVKLDETGLILSSYDAGSYTVTVVDSLGCTKTETLFIDKVQEPEVTFEGFTDICLDETTKIDISGSASSAKGVVGYTENGVSKTITLDNTGKATISGIDETSTFVFATLKIDDFTYGLNETVQIDEISTPFASINTQTYGVCSGDVVTIPVTGTPEATVEFLNGDRITLNSTGNGSYAFTATTTRQVQIKEVVGFSCPQQITGTATVNVTQKPTLSILNQTCNNDLTEKSLIFNKITSLKYKSNGAIIPVSNNTATVTVPTVVTATYVTGSCEVDTDFTVTGCECVLQATLAGEEICSGGDVTLSPTHNGSNPVTYLWHDGSTSATLTLTNITEDTAVSVTITDSVNGCESTVNALVEVTDAPSPQISAAEITSTSLNNWEMSIDDTGRFSYNGQGTVVWRDLDDNSVLSSSNTWWPNTSTAKVYNFRLEVTLNGCTVQSAAQTLDVVCVEPSSIVLTFGNTTCPTGTVGAETLPPGTYPLSSYPQFVDGGAVNMTLDNEGTGNDLSTLTGATVTNQFDGITCANVTDNIADATDSGTTTVTLTYCGTTYSWVFRHDVV